MKMTAAEFVALVREYRGLINRFHGWEHGHWEKLEGYPDCKEVIRLEHQIDEAEISDPANLVTDSPLN